MVEQTIKAMQPDAADFCDIGCGGGNFSLRIARQLPKLAVTLLDLSGPMLDRATQRLIAEGFTVKAAIQDDIRTVSFEPDSFDTMLASASLHHLRTHEEWHAVFARVFRALRPGGAFWICDLIKHENLAAEEVQRRRYADYLTELDGKAYQEEIFDMIARTDTPETIDFQMQTLRGAGFRNLDIVHKNMLNFAVVARKF